MFFLSIHKLVVFVWVLQGKQNKKFHKILLKDYPCRSNKVERRKRDMNDGVETKLLQTRGTATFNRNPILPGTMVLWARWGRREINYTLRDTVVSSKRWGFLKTEIIKSNQLIEFRHCTQQCLVHDEPICMRPRRRINHVRTGNFAAPCKS